MLFAARKLVKSYAAGRPGCSATVRVLDGVNLELAPGGIVGITGRRGSGKTTLVRCAAGLARPDAGALHWHPTARRSRVVALAAPAYAFETAHDVMHRACIEPTVDRDRLLALLDDLDLTSRLQAPQSALTTDERARFAIAVGLARRHPLVLLDGTADALARESLPLTTALLTRHCAEGGAVLVTGRDATAVRALAVDVRTLSDGRLQLPAPAADPPSVARVAEPHSTAAVR